MPSVPIASPAANIEVKTLVPQNLSKPSDKGNDIGKVEKILKGSLVSIPSPSPSGKIQIMGGKVCLRYKGKTLLDVVNKLFVFKS